MGQLPLELWYLVADDLAPAQMRAFLAISQLHRSIALKVLFSHVHVFFGAPEPCEYPEMSEEAVEQAYESTMSRTWDLLNAIRSNPSFARVVKKLTIYAFLEGEAFGAFYRGAVCDALRSLSHLVAFSWVGKSPTIPAQVLDSVITHCRDLQKMNIPLQDFPAVETPMALLTYLTHFVFRGFPEHGDDSARRVLPHLEEMLKAQSVLSLSLPTAILWNLPIRAFENLMDLEISHGKDLQNMDLIFHHVPNLTSLTFLDLHDDHLFAVLFENSAKMPHLTSLKIKAEDPHFIYLPSSLSQLSEFIKNKLELQRLDVQLACFSISPLLEILPGLTALKVLGLFTGIHFSTKDDYLNLGATITPKLTALRLSTLWDFTPENRGAVDELIQRFNQLSFLYLRSVGAPFAFLMDEFASDLKNISILGMDQRLSYVERNTKDCGEEGTGMQVETIPWSSRRVHYRCTEDFGDCEDYEWLLRHHSLKEWAW